MKAAVIVGPTAAGKTKISLALAGDIFEIISSDSVQVYRYLDIGSGKPSRADREKVPHYLIDIADPDVKFSAGDFCAEADRAVVEIFKKGKIPLFAGGTGLYIDSFFKGLSDIPPVNRSIKEELDKELESRGLDSLYGELLGIDGVFAGRIHHNDRQRILRGLEVYRGTGKPLSGYFGRRAGRESPETLYIGITAEKEVLHERINRRVDEMVEAGFVDEVRGLRKMGYGPDLNSMKSIGYADINEYLDGIITLDEAVIKIKSLTRKYAKRQLTWFRKNTSIHWYSYFEVEKIRLLLYTWFNV